MVQVSLQSILDASKNSGRRRRRRRARVADEEAGFGEDNFFDDDFDKMFEPSDPSVEHYPEPFCGMVEGAFRCYKMLTDVAYFNIYL